MAALVASGVGSASAACEEGSSAACGGSATASEDFFACYLLRSLDPSAHGRTYIGFTVNPKRRLRQHNGEVKGGARKTSRHRPWEMLAFVHGFTNKVSALQFEWAWQKPMLSLHVRDHIGHLSLKKRTYSASKLLQVLPVMAALPRYASHPLTVHFLRGTWSSGMVSGMESCSEGLGSAAPAERGSTARTSFEALEADFFKALETVPSGARAQAHRIGRDVTYGCPEQAGILRAPTSRRRKVVVNKVVENRVVVNKVVENRVPECSAAPDGGADGGLVGSGVVGSGQVRAEMRGGLRGGLRKGWSDGGAVIDLEDESFNGWESDTWWEDGLGAEGGSASENGSGHASDHQSDHQSDHEDANCRDALLLSQVRQGEACGKREEGVFPPACDETEEDAELAEWLEQARRIDSSASIAIDLESGDSDFGTGSSDRFSSDRPSSDRPSSDRFEAVGGGFTDVGAFSRREPMSPSEHSRGFSTTREPISAISRGHSQKSQRRLGEGERSPLARQSLGRANSPSILRALGRDACSHNRRGQRVQDHSVEDLVAEEILDVSDCGVDSLLQRLQKRVTLEG